MWRNRLLILLALFGAFLMLDRAFDDGTVFDFTRTQRDLALCAIGVAALWALRLREYWHRGRRMDSDAGGRRENREPSSIPTPKPVEVRLLLLGALGAGAGIISSYLVWNWLQYPFGYTFVIFFACVWLSSVGAFVAYRLPHRFRMEVPRVVEVAILDAVLLWCFHIVLRVGGISQREEYVHATEVAAWVVGVVPILVVLIKSWIRPQ